MVLFTANFTLERELYGIILSYFFLENPPVTIKISEALQGFLFLSFHEYSEVWLINYAVIMNKG